VSYLFLNVALALVWAALTGQFTPANLLLGFVLGYLTLLAARRALGPSSYFQRMRQAVGFVVFFLWELIRANLRVAHDVLTPQRIQPRVIAVPLDARTDAEIAALATCVSLTPGTLTLDVSNDRREIYIHAMSCSDAEATKRDLKRGLERRLLELMRGAPPQEDGAV